MELLEGFKVLFLGMFIFFGAHLGLGGFRVRNALIEKFGFLKFRAGHSILSLMGFYLIVVGFGARPMFNVYYPSYDDYMVTATLVPIGFIFLAAAASPKFKYITRHPMLWGLFIFSIAHLNANGDLGSVFLFSGFSIYSLWAMYIADRRRTLGKENEFEKILVNTSVIPFYGLIKGKAKWPGGFVWILKPVIIGLILAGFIVNFHIYIAGIPLSFG